MPERDECPLEHPPSEIFAPTHAGIQSTPHTALLTLETSREQSAHNRKVNELHISALEALRGLTIGAKNILWTILKDQDAWPPHLRGSDDQAHQQSGVWSAQKERSLLTFRRVLRPTVG
jgi:hypothetical protein